MNCKVKDPPLREGAEAERTSKNMLGWRGVFLISSSVSCRQGNLRARGWMPFSMLIRTERRRGNCWKAVKRLKSSLSLCERSLDRIRWARRSQAFRDEKICQVGLRRRILFRARCQVCKKETSCLSPQEGSHRRQH